MSTRNNLGSPMTPIVGTPENFLNNHKPTNTGEYAVGLVIVSITFAFCLWLWLHYKTKSPSAKAEMDLKLDLTTEINSFKESINGRHNDLDLKISLTREKQLHLEEKMNTYEMTMKQNFSGLHKRFSKLEETLNLILMDVKG